MRIRLHIKGICSKQIEIRKSEMRKFIGNETLLTVGCGVIIEEDERILLQHRTDEDKLVYSRRGNGNW